MESILGTELGPMPPSRCASACCFGENNHKDSYVESLRHDRYVGRWMPQDPTQEPSISVYPRRLQDVHLDVAVTDDNYLIMSMVAYGFILRSRKWAKLDLTYLAPPHFPTTSTFDSFGDEAHYGAAKQVVPPRLAFEQLVLPDGHKDMVLSLIAQHYRDKQTQNGEREQVDIIRGKGKGLILLLHGAPGVGKTTTAEGVAEMFQKPLFQITCGDLGVTAREVETSLETHFALASKWGCILLLDEADVFLAARTPQDFVRNGMVSVFLRVLEYYSGILFLTTNRIGDFDEAFGSRIHISLHYPQLDLSSTLKIFELNLDLIRDRFKRRNRDLSIDTRAILEYAAGYWTNNEHMRWNARQIRNACNTALALAEFSAQGGDHTKVVDANAKISLKLEHLETVSKAYLGFITYLEDVFDKDADRRAKQMMIRAREHKKSMEQGGGQRQPSFSGGLGQTPIMPTHTTAQGLWPPMPQPPQNPSPTISSQLPGYLAASSQIPLFQSYPNHMMTGQHSSQPLPGQPYPHYTLTSAYPQGVQPGSTAYQQPHQASTMAGPSQTQTQASMQPPPGWQVTAYSHGSMPTGQPGQVVAGPHQPVVPVMEPQQTQP